MFSRLFRRIVCVAEVFPRLLVASALLIPAAAPAPGSAEPAVRGDSRAIMVDRSMPVTPIGEKVDYYLDKAASLTIGEVANPDFSPRFTQSTTQRGNLGFVNMDRNVWFRFTVSNPSDKPLEWIWAESHPHFHLITFYEPDGENGGWREKKAGIMFPHAARDIRNRLIAFRQTTPPRTTVMYYVRYTINSVDAAVFSPTLAARDRFEESSYANYLILGVFFGILGAMFLYNLFLYFVIRNAVYLHYIGYVAGVIFSFLADDGIASQFFWPGSTYLSEYAVGYAGMMLFYFSTQFARSFLNTKTLMPWADNWLRFVLAVCVGGAVLFALGAYNGGMSVVEVLGVFSIGNIFIAILALKRGYRPAKYYLLAQSVWLAGVSLFSLSMQSVAVPWLLVRSILHLAFVLDVLLFSFALAERIRLINELQEAKEQAEAATRLKDDFVALVSHDLRSPLLSTVAGLKLLGDGGMGPLSQTQKDFMDLIIRKNTQLLDTVKSLLDTSMMRRGKMELRRDHFFIRDVLETSVEKLAPAAAAKNISITRDIPQTLEFYGDALLFGEVVYNVILNAIKFTPKGGAVDIRASANGTASLVIKDSGVGVSPEMLPNLLRHEVRTTSPGTEGEAGTGLGLPYCNEIMKTHGGSIRVESAPGGGTTVHLELPPPPAA